MSEAAKLDKIYEMVLKMDGIIPNLMTKLECHDRHQANAMKIDRVYIVCGAVAGTFSFVGTAIGFYLKAKGLI
jgi:hypothetical protein